MGGVEKEVIGEIPSQRIGEKYEFRIPARFLPFDRKDWNWVYDEEETLP